MEVLLTFNDMLLILSGGIEVSDLLDLLVRKF